MIYQAGVTLFQHVTFKSGDNTQPFSNAAFSVIHDLCNWFQWPFHGVCQKMRCSMVLPNPKGLPSLPAFVGHIHLLLLIEISGELHFCAPHPYLHSQTDDHIPPNRHRCLQRDKFWKYIRHRQHAVTAALFHTPAMTIHQSFPLVVDRHAIQMDHVWSYKDIDDEIQGFRCFTDKH